MISLSKRLDTVAALVPKCEVCADIGCDHGLLSAYLLQAGIAQKVILTDISKKSLQKASTLFKQQGLTGKAEFYLADGLRGVREPIDCAVISGMGGREIIKIISDSGFAADTYILQPMKNADILRIFLADNGFMVIYDRCLLQEDKFYDIIKAKKGSDKLTKREIMFGRTNLLDMHTDFIRYLCAKHRELSGIKDRTKTDPERYNYICSYLAGAEKLLLDAGFSIGYAK